MKSTAGGVAAAASSCVNLSNTRRRCSAAASGPSKSCGWAVLACVSSSSQRRCASADVAARRSLHVVWWIRPISGPNGRPRVGRRQRHSSTEAGSRATDQCCHSRDRQRVVDGVADQVLVDVGHRGAADLDGGDDAGQAALDQRDVGRLDRHVGAGADRQAHVGLGQRRGVVDAIADHRHALVLQLEPLHVQPTLRRRLWSLWLRMRYSTSRRLLRFTAAAERLDQRRLARRRLRDCRHPLDADR